MIDFIYAHYIEEFVRDCPEYSLAASAFETMLDDYVKDGRMTQAEADKLYEAMTDAASCQLEDGFRHGMRFMYRLCSQLGTKEVLA